MRLKHMRFAVLEDIHLDGPATRKELWERNQVCSWEMFKRLIGHLTADGVIERRVATPGSTDPKVDTWGLTPAGEQIVQELLGE